MTMIMGTPGDDTLVGTSGDDVFMGSYGSDAITGGGGYNILDYRQYAGAVFGHPPQRHTDAYYGHIVVVFDAAGYSGTVTNKALGQLGIAARGTDTFVEIHGILGTSGRDTLIGSDADDLPVPILLRGEGGSDTIDGRQSLLNLVSYASSVVGVVVHLETTQDAGGGWSGSASDGIGFLDGLANTTHNSEPGLYPGQDTLIGVRRVEGSSFGDTITGSHVADLLDGGAGDDTLTGGAGDDTLLGGAGLDTAIFNGTSDQTQLQRQQDGSWIATGPDGVDTLIGIDLARFADVESWIGQTQPGDFDRDGKTDLLWQHTNGQVAVWTMNGTQLVSGAFVDTNPGAEWRAVGTGDFDGDGKADILWQHADGPAAVWTMNGTQLVSGELVGPNPGPEWRAVGTGDFDGDGKADILWQHADGQAAVWTMNGAQLAHGALIDTNPGTEWRAAAAGDFDGDGRADVLWQHVDGQAAIWTMSGTQLVSGALIDPNPGTEWRAAGAGDFDGDGKAEILWQHANGQAAAWIMDGAHLVSGGFIGPNPESDWSLT
jgi:hypothetical protein